MTFESGLFKTHLWRPFLCGMEARELWIYRLERCSKGQWGAGEWCGGRAGLLLGQQPLRTPESGTLQVPACPRELIILLQTPELREPLPTWPPWVGAEDPQDVSSWGEAAQGGGRYQLKPFASTEAKGPCGWTWASYRFFPVLSEWLVCDDQHMYLSQFSVRTSSRSSALMGNKARNGGTVWGFLFMFQLIIVVVRLPVLVGFLFFFFFLTSLLEYNCFTMVC